MYDIQHLATSPELVSDLTPAYSWDPRSTRYRDVTNGRYVGTTTIRGAIDDFLDTTSGQMTDLTQSMIDGEISLDTYRQEMVGIVKSVHLANAAAAKGGWAQMDDQDFQTVSSRLQDQYQYLSGFIDDIESGDQPLDATMLIRSGMYAQAGRGTYHLVERDTKEEAGFTEERSVLDPGTASHCDDCMDQAAEDWQPIGQMTPIGERQCGVMDRCDVEYRVGDDQADETDQTDDVGSDAEEFAEDDGGVR